MRVPFGWLQDFVKIDVSPEEVCEYLVMLGFSDVQVLPGEWGCLENFLTGRATKVESHPSNPKLKVVEVNVGYTSLISVCGAPNVNLGEMYPVAMPGSTLGSGKVVETASIDGVESQCILCSGWEAWLDDSRDELLKLDSHIAPGTRLIEALRLDDPVIELDVTPNRGDCLGLIGIARELAAVFGKELIIPEPAFNEDGPIVEELASVEIEDAEGCPRYGAIVLEDVVVRGAPAETRARLRQAGLRPINNVVDAANMVLFETGHPLHTFDLDKIKDGRIIVRRAAKGEKITAIDDVEYKLESEDVVIADPDGPIAIAGVIGGEDSEVGPDTRRVLIEGAFFDHAFIWRTSKRLGIASEAAYRFARVVDVGAVLYVIARTASMIQGDTKCRVSTGMIDVYPNPVLPRHVLANPKRVNRLLGTSIPEQEILDYLERLGFLVSPGKDLEVVVPTRRTDVLGEADIAEEVGRLYGYDRIDLTTGHSRDSHGKYPSESVDKMRVREMLVGIGLNEAVTDPTMGPEKTDFFGLASPELVEIRNPVGVQNSVMRPSLLPGMADVLVKNERQGQEEVGFFELGSTYAKQGDGFEETVRLAIGLSGTCRPRQWHTKPRPFDFFDLKGIVEGVSEAMGTGIAFEPGAHGKLHAGRQAEIRLAQTDNDSVIGYLGELAPDICEALGSKRRLYIAELDFHLLREASGDSGRYRSLDRYPAVKRDLAVIIPKKILESQVRSVILANGGNLVESVELFDVYEGEQIPPGTKSLAYAIVFRSPERTLTEAEIDSRQKDMESALESDFGGKIRMKS
jgi:phenylalanyl-tRNA synthetase beta chain